MSDKIQIVRVLSLDMMEVISLDIDYEEEDRFADMGIKAPKREKIKAKQYRLMINLNHIDGIMESDIEEAVEITMKSGRVYTVQCQYDLLKAILIEPDEETKQIQN